jgi:hypothetical protein
LELGEIGWDVMDWIHLSQHRHQPTRWRTFGFRNISVNSWVADQLAASQWGFSYLESVCECESQIHGTTEPASWTDTGWKPVVSFQTMEWGFLFSTESRRIYPTDIVGYLHEINSSWV